MGCDSEGHLTMMSAHPDTTFQILFFTAIAGDYLTDKIFLIACNGC